MTNTHQLPPELPADAEAARLALLRFAELNMAKALAEQSRILADDRRVMTKDTAREIVALTLSLARMKKMLDPERAAPADAAVPKAPSPIAPAADSAPLADHPSAAHRPAADAPSPAPTDAGLPQPSRPPSPPGQEPHVPEVPLRAASAETNRPGGEAAVPIDPRYSIERRNAFGQRVGGSPTGGQRVGAAPPVGQDSVGAPPGLGPPAPHRADPAPHAARGG